MHLATTGAAVVPSVDSRPDVEHRASASTTSRRYEGSWALGAIPMNPTSCERLSAHCSCSYSEFDTVIATYFNQPSALFIRRKANELC